MLCTDGTLMTKETSSAAEQAGPQHAPKSKLKSSSLGVLNWNQVRKLDTLLDKFVPIHGRGNYPTLNVKLKDFIGSLHRRLIDQRVKVRDVRINGGVASYVLAKEDDYQFSDIDIIFTCDLLQLEDEAPTTNPDASFASCCDLIKQTVFDLLLDQLPAQMVRDKFGWPYVKDAYVKKMVKVYQTCSSIDLISDESAESQQTSSRWSLISLCNNQGQNIELKFVDKMKRQFQFSVDAFQIHLDSLLRFYELNNDAQMTENFYPTVVAESMYGEFDVANFHLNNKLIATKSPEEIRGGGLLKYCNLLVRGYKPVCDGAEMHTLEKYMCSRFFIDFSDINEQEHKLNAYLDSHFQNDAEMCVLYLAKLYEVVNASTVCLMGHERKQTLNLIEALAQRFTTEYKWFFRAQHENDYDELVSNNEENDSTESEIADLTGHFKYQSRRHRNNSHSNISSSSNNFYHQSPYERNLRQQQQQQNYQHQQQQQLQQHDLYNYNLYNPMFIQSQQFYKFQYMMYNNNNMNSRHLGVQYYPKFNEAEESWKRRQTTTRKSPSQNRLSVNQEKQQQNVVISSSCSSSSSSSPSPSPSPPSSTAVTITNSTNSLLSSSSSSSLSSSSIASSIVSSPSPSPPPNTTTTTAAAVATTPPTTTPTFYITLAADHEPPTQPSKSSIFQCKIAATQSTAPYIEVFYNYFAPPVFPSSSLPSTPTDGNNSVVQGVIETRILPSYVLCSTPPATLAS